MMQRARRRFSTPLGFVLGAAAGLLVAATPVIAQDGAQLMDDFVHYARTAKPDLAVANAQALMSLGLTNAELAMIIDSGKVRLDRFEDAIRWSQRVPQLADVASDLASRIEAGRLDLARDVKRVDEAIAMLGRDMRAKDIAKKRLEAAGEYAVPALLKQITEGRDESLKLACEDVLRVNIGRLAVTPLCEALPSIDSNSQRIVCDILGDIGYPHAAPHIIELAGAAGTPGPVKEAADRALGRLNVAASDASTAFTDLALRYFNEERALVAYPLEPTNNVWKYDAFVGLTAQPVNTAIYNEVMSMRCSGHALKLNPAASGAISLFVAANLKRENDLPKEAADPIYGDLQYTPDFYATVFGTQVCLDVLGMAIDRLDTALVRDAIRALSQTTGGSNLFASRGTTRQPLLEALTYPDRRVQYEAALTLGRALPQQGFANDFTVVPVLASAVRTGNQSFAVIVGDNEEDRRQTAAWLTAGGFTVVASGGDVPAMQPDIAASVGVDLVVVQRRAVDTAKQTVAALRNVAKTVAAPVLVLAPQLDMLVLKQDFDAQRRVHVARIDASQEAFNASIDDLLIRASGGRMTEAESMAYAIEAISALRDIAISNSPIYKIADAEGALLEALNNQSGGARLLVADIVALIDSDRAQRRLLDAALSSATDEQVDLLTRAAESVKRFGDRAEQRHVDALVELVSKSGGPSAEAAARLHGALNIPTPEAVKLIPQG